MGNQRIKQNNKPLQKKKKLGNSKNKQKETSCLKEKGKLENQWIKRTKKAFKKESRKSKNQKEEQGLLKEIKANGK